MPELGKATYLLELNSSQYMSGLAKADEETTAVTNNMAAAFGKVDGSFQATGAEAQTAGGEISTSMKEAAAGMNTAADEMVVAADKMSAATAGAAAKSGAAAAKSATGWGMLGSRVKKFGSMGAMGGMVGLAGAYYMLSGGYHWLKDTQQGWTLVKNGIAATGGVAGVSQQHLNKLAESYVKLTGNSKGLNLTLESMLLRFKDIRNIGPGIGMIYDRVFAHVNNIAEASGRSVNTVAMQLGKALNDPAKYMTSLSRAGITFSSSQIAVAKQLEATKGVAAAQEYVLAQLDKRYGGVSNGVEDTAHRMQNTINVQMKVASDRIKSASANLITAFMPALLQLAHIVVPVTEYMAKHASVLRQLIILYIGAKVAAFALTKAWTLGKIALGAYRIVMIAAALATKQMGWAEAKTAFQTKVLGMSSKEAAGGIEAETVASKTATTATLRLRAGLLLTRLAFLGVVAAGAAAVMVLEHYINKTKEAQKQADEAGKRVDKMQSTKFGLSAEVFNLQYAKFIKQGDSPAEARRKAYALIRKDPHLDPHFGEKHDPLRNKYSDVMSGRHHHHHRHHYAKAPGTSQSTIPASQQALGARYTSLEDAVLKAQITSTNKDDIKSLTNLQDYLENRLKTDKNLTPQERQQLLRTLASTHRALLTAEKKKATKSGATATGKNLIPASMQIDLSKAEQAALHGNYRPEIHALGDEKRYLEDRLKHTKNMKERAAIEAELTSVETKLVAAKKAELQAGDGLTKQMEKMVQAAMDLRGTFFTQYSSSIFGTDTTGRAVPGGKHTHVHQTNHYNEIPKDRHHHARKVRKALAGAVS